MTNPPTNPPRSHERLFFVFCLVATVVAVILHGVNLVFAGAFWRDEAGGIDLANSATVGEMWRMLGHDSFPALFPVLIRAWSAVGFGHNDFGLRLLGCLVGLALLGLLWLNARAIKSPLPMLSLALFALNPLVIRWGDSLRAYGVGALLIMLTFMLVWSFVCLPSARRFVPASFAGVLSVQCLYQNAFLLLAICGSAALICVRRQRVARAGWVLALGMPAALSLLPYWPLIRESQRWWVVEKIGFRPAIVGGTLWDALSSPPLLGPLLWITFFGAAVVLGFRAFEARAVRHRALEEDLPVFGALTALGGVLLFFVFVAFSGLPTQPWYWVTLLGLLALCFDVTFVRQLMAPRRWLPAALVTFICLSVAFSIAPITRRMTNTDRVAAKVGALALPSDLVLVYPWYCGVSFNRYYFGRAAWTTVPELSDHGFHRYDLLKEKLRMPNPLQPTIERIKKTLVAGNSVWVVGSLPAPPSDVAPPAELPPAPDGPNGWFDEPYNQAWGVKLAYFFQSQARNVEPIVLDEDLRVERYENLALIRVRGYRGAAFAQPP